MVNIKDIFVKYFQSLKIIVITTRYGGYTYLQNVMRNVHTIFLEDTVELYILMQGNVTTFPVHVKNDMTFIDIKDLWVNTFTK